MRLRASGDRGDVETSSFDQHENQKARNKMNDPQEIHEDENENGGGDEDVVQCLRLLRFRAARCANPPRIVSFKCKVQCSSKNNANML